MDCTITSPARPSARNPGWHFAYYDTIPPTPDKRLCVLVAPAIADLVKPGFRFCSSSTRFDEALNFSVLELDFDEPQGGELNSLPPDPASGWGDPDDLLAASNGAAVLTLPKPMITPTPTQQRRHAAERALSNSQLPAELLNITREVNAVFQVHYSMLSNIDQHQRAMTAQKLTATTLIPWYRQRGIDLSPEDEKSMTI